MGASTLHFSDRTPAPASAKKDLNEAKARFKEGKALYAQGKIDDARLKFLQACAVLQDDTCMRNLSVAEYYSGHYVEAYRDIKSLLARGVLKAEPQVQREFEEMARQAYDKTGHIQVKGVDGSVVVIDEREKAGTCPISDPVDVVIGKHVIVARKDDQIERREVDAPAGKITQVDLTPAAVTPPPGGGNDVKPPVGGDVKPPGGDVTPPGGENPPPKGGKIPVASYVLGGAGLVGIVGGIIFGAVSSGAASDVKNATPGVCSSMTSAGCQDLQSSADSANTFHTVSIVSYVAGSVLLAGGIAFAVVGLTKKEAAPVAAKTTWFAPTILPGGAGLACAGTF